MKKKRIWLMLLTAFTVLFVAACSKKEEAKEEEAAPEVNLEELQTEAEASGWEETTSSQGVIDFCQTVADNSDGRIILDTTTFKTEFDTPIPYMIISDKAPESPEEAEEAATVEKKGRPGISHGIPKKLLHSRFPKKRSRHAYDSLSADVPRL